MSNPYGPPPGGQPGPGQPGSYGAPGGSPSWTPGAPGPAYGQPAPGGYAAPNAGPPVGGPPAGYGQPYGQSGPGQGTPGNGNNPQFPSSPPKVETPLDLGKILPLVIAGLGVLAFIVGFLPGVKYSGGANFSASVYGVQGYLPILILLAGAFAAAPLIPGGRSYSLPTAIVAVVGFLGAITATFSGTSGYLGDGYSKGFGLWLILIVSLLQAAAAAYSWFTEAGSGKPARSAAERGSGHTARSFGPSQPPAPPTAPAQPAQSAPTGYAPPAYGQGDASSYGGYTPGAYSQAPPGAASGPNTEGFGAYGQPSEAGPQTGSSPAVDPGAPYSPYGPGPSNSAGPSTGAHGRDDGPPPDVTQQVRF